MSPPWRHRLLRAYLWAVVAFVLAPIVFVVVNSFNGVAYSVFPPKGLSVQWYARVFAQEGFREGLVNSVVVALLTSALALALGTPAAVALARRRFFGRELVQGIFMSPVVVPKMILGVAAFAWLGMLGLLGRLAGLVLVHTVVALPFVITVLAANLAGTDPSLEEAALDLGATPLRAFLAVTLPQVRPGLVVSAVFSFITSFDQVETSMFLVGPTTRMLPIEMFLYMEKWQDPTIAALSAMLLLLSGLLLLVVQAGLSGGQRAGLLGARRQPERVPAAQRA